MDLDNLYQALANAETGNEQNPWIRTRFQPPEGSSAFGPVQITKGLIEDAIARGILQPTQQSFAQEIMLPMQGQFLKYGGNKNLAPERKAFDYGGSGNFDPMNQDAYSFMAKQLIEDAANKATVDGVFNSDKFLKIWRGAKPEKSYAKRFYSVYKAPSHYK